MYYVYVSTCACKPVFGETKAQTQPDTTFMLQGCPLPPGPFTLDSQLSTGIDGAMLIFCHTLVHARVLQAQLRESQVPSQDLHPVLCRRAKAGQGDQNHCRTERGPGVVVMWCKG